MSYNIYIAKRLYENPLCKGVKWLQGVWFMCGEVGVYLSRETYQNTWSGIFICNSYQKSFGELSDDELIKYFKNLVNTKEYQQYIEDLENTEELELWAEEAPSVQGYEDCITSEDWIVDVNTNNLKAA